MDRGEVDCGGVDGGGEREEGVVREEERAGERGEV